MKTIFCICILIFLYCLSLPEGNAQEVKSKSGVEPFNSYVLVPKAFSPNFDGINDVFKVTGRDVTKFEIYIYNRQGQMVYHSEDIDAEWDGKFNGILAMSGVYVWIIEYEGHNSAMEPLKHTIRGNVTLLL